MSESDALNAAQLADSQIPSGANFDTDACTFSWTPTDASLVGQSVEVGFQVEADEGGEPVPLVAAATLAILDFANRQVFIYQVPAPGAVAVLGLGGLAAARRRRA